MERSLLLLVVRGVDGRTTLYEANKLVGWWAATFVVTTVKRVQWWGGFFICLYLSMARVLSGGGARGSRRPGFREDHKYGVGGARFCSTQDFDECFSLRSSGGGAE